MVEPMNKSDWSELPRDLLAEIARRTTSLEDLNAFRGVCSSWRTSVCRKQGEECLEFHNLSEPRMPFLMFRGEKDEEYYNLFSLSKGKTCMRRLRVPGVRMEKKYIESRFGWLLCSDAPGEDVNLELLNPFSGARIPAPNPRSGHLCMIKFVLSADPSVAPDDFTVVVMVDYGSMAFWRPGEENWTWFETGFEDVIFSDRDRKFYAVNFLDILSWDGGAGGGSKQWTVVARATDNPSPMCSVYMVESSDGELLLAINDFGSEEEMLSMFSADSFIQLRKNSWKVYGVDSSKGTVEERLTSLKDVIFISDTVSLAVPPNQLLQSNHIYITSVDYGRREKHICNLEDGTIQSFSPSLQLLVDSDSLLWVAPPSTFSWFG